MVGLHSTGWEQQNVVGNLVIAPLAFLGGVFYRSTPSAEPWRGLTHADPIFYMVVAARHGTLGGSEVPLGLSLGVTLGLAAAMLAWAWSTFRARGRDLTPPARRVPYHGGMDPGDILSRTWELYRAHWRHLIAIAAVIYVPLGAVSAGLALIGWPGVLAGNILNLAAIFLVQGPS